jgi:IS5 family transposase
VGKVLSWFEPSTKVIRKGKAHKPTEFGQVVRINEVENGMVSGYEVLEGNRADTNSFLPALEHHPACFGQAPQMATADRGILFCRERTAGATAWSRAGGPVGAGPVVADAGETTEATWFRRALRWRAGVEATISTLKHPFSMVRARCKGERGLERYVGWSVITKNLFSIARWQERGKKEEELCPRRGNP